MGEDGTDVAAAGPSRLRRLAPRSFRASIVASTVGVMTVAMIVVVLGTYLVLERTANRDKAMSLFGYRAQLRAIHRWGRQDPADLSVIAQPVLVANGAHDRMVPSSNSRDLAHRVPHSDLVRYPDAGHGGIFQDHDEFVAKALTFLES